jgi:UDP-hydrolysing UDP-N-acetyl-D-glucosamine 2-epimerase
MAKKKRTIAVVTGTRAEFGLLDPVMRAIAARRELNLRVVVAGLHLSQDTWKDITAGGFKIDARVRMQIKGATGRAADVAAMGRGVVGFGKTFEQIKPDFVVVLGDRIEAFAAASAASVGGYRVAQIHAGDRAEGVADESMRHAISKLAHLHLAATPRSRARLTRMGEHGWSVHNVGSPAVDGLADVQPAADAPRLIVLQHPIGETDAKEQRWMKQTLAATKSHERLVMMPNGDPGSEGIRQGIRAAKVKAVTHLPRARWLAILAGCDAIVGNGSAGLIEAAVLKTPCVNIGPRQAGREKPRNVIDCDYGKANVEAAVDRALKMNRRKLHHPYGYGNTAERIAHLLATVDLNVITVRKHNAY